MWCEAPCFSPLFDFGVSQVLLPTQATATRSLSQARDPNRRFNNPTLYFFYLQPLLACFGSPRLKSTVKREKIQCHLFVSTIHMTTYLLCLINSRGKKKRKGGQEVRSDERMELSGTEESRKLPGPGQHKWDTVEPQEGEKERLEVRSQCFRTSNSRQGWYFARVLSGCDPRTPASRQGF